LGKHTSNLGDTTLQAIKGLKPSGDRSFEKLTAILLSNLLGINIRLCKSGYQAGTDALADDIPFAIEDKRYQDEKLNLRELEGELAAAARTYPDLQLWVLVTTTAVGAYDYTALNNTGEKLGLAILILDKTAAEPELSDLVSIVALCATDIETTLKAINDQDWLDSRYSGNMPPITAVEADLKTIQGIPRFSEWMNHLRRKLTDLPLWQLVVERQNSRLAKILEEDALVSLGTAFDPLKVIPRTAKNKINEWLAMAIKSPEPELAVVLGERFDGKTWCVFDWLKDNLRSLQIPVFFIASSRGMASTKKLYDHIYDDIKQVLGSFERHAEAIIRQRRGMMTDSTPWCLLILDGLNEYGPFPNNRCLLNHLTWANGRIDNVRPCAVLATVRQQSWKDLDSKGPDNLVKGKKCLIQIGSYDDTEFQIALQSHGLPPDYLQSIPDAARTIVRRPRYFGLVVDYKDKLGRYDSVTPCVLHWLDACDKISRSRSSPAYGWDEEHYQGVLRELAERYIEQRTLKLTELRSIIGQLTSDISTILNDLKSEGVITKNPNGLYSVAADRLALGMGFYLLQELRVTYEQGNNKIVERLRDLLSPAQETEEMISWLRAATTMEVLSNFQQPGEEVIVDALVNEWLRSRNLSVQDFQEIKAIRRFLLRSLLRLAPKTWSFNMGDQRLRELSRLIFIDGLDTEKGFIGRAMRTWFRLVPTGEAFLNRRGKNPEATIAAIHEEINAPDIADLELKIEPHGDLGILNLKSIGLFLANKSPDIVGLDDLLALIAGHVITRSDPNDGDKFILRRLLAQVKVKWIEEQVCYLPSSTEGHRRKALHWLINYAQREDLSAFKKNVKSPSDLQWELQIKQYTFDRAWYNEIYTKPFAPDDDPACFIESSAKLVCDPTLPMPGDERMIKIRETLKNIFSNVNLKSGQFSSKEDIQFKNMLPVMAAWAPAIGADIIRRQMINLPTRLPEQQHWWAYDFTDHAVLVHGTARAALSKVLKESSPNTNEVPLALGHVLLALLPGMQPVERVIALINHPLGDFEWTRLYHLIANLIDTEEIKYALTLLRSEADPLLRRRLRYLLGNTEYIDLSADDIESLIEAIASSDFHDRFSALALAAIGRVKCIPPEVLIPLATDTTDKQSSTPGYAAWLIVHSDAFNSVNYGNLVAQLLPQWRAVAATKRADLCANFLQEVEQALYDDQGIKSEKSRSQTALAAPVDIKISKGGDLPLQQRFSLSLELLPEVFYSNGPESRTNNKTGQDDNRQIVSDGFLNSSKTASERLKSLQKEVSEELAHRCTDQRMCWSGNDFPQSLIDQMYKQNRSRFEAWLDALLANRVKTKHYWGGLVMPMFRAAIRNGNPRAKDLWDLVFPFQPDGVSFGTRFVIDGLDWTLLELSHPAADDKIATCLLIELVSQALSDWELFQIALGARHQGQDRLIRIVRTLIGCSDFEMRARAVRVAGWLEGMSVEIAEIKNTDSSLWVRYIAGQALMSVDDEIWARHWFSIFTDEVESDIRRWGAGQLFLTCVDHRFQVWARPMVNQPKLPDRIRGEAILLLDAAAQRSSTKKDQTLIDKFLLHNVIDLRAVCDPWYRALEWVELTMNRSQ